MKLKIGKYLQKNRLKLDVETPDDNVIWRGIRKELHPQRQIPGGWFWKAAAIFLLGVLTTYVVVRENPNEKVVVITLADISEDLGKREAALKFLVDKKWEEIHPLSAKETSQFQFLLDELNELDNVYKTYEQDLYKTGENEQIVRALLDYYEKKIKILNRLSLEIEKQKNYENTISL
jgi:hypothetical protein